jgi:hypothetical protein
MASKPCPAWDDIGQRSIGEDSRFRHATDHTPLLAARTHLGDVALNERWRSLGNFLNTFIGQGQRLISTIPAIMHPLLI